MPLYLKSFAVRFQYGSPTVILDFDEPATVVIPDVVPVVGRNVAVSGRAETLFGRHDTFMTLSWTALSSAKTQEFAGWWGNWGSRGMQTAITLDRQFSGGGQIEYDMWNVYFDKAEVWGGPQNAQIPPALVRRFALEVVKYTVGPITFRQGY